ncbi:MAG: sugar transferase [Actinomycetota bacterium]|nr:sugar transferase [Actinomycetota bacterium]
MGVEDNEYEPNLCLRRLRKLTVETESAFSIVSGKGTVDDAELSDPPLEGQEPQPERGQTEGVERERPGTARGELVEIDRPPTTPPTAVAPPRTSSGHIEHLSYSKAATTSKWSLIGWQLFATDALCLVGALAFSYLIRYGSRSLPLGYLLVILLGPIAWGGVFHAFGLYAPRHLSAAEEFRRTISATSIGIFMVVMTSFWSHSDLSRIWIGLSWLFALTFELVARRVWRWHIARMRKDGRLAMRTLVVGSNAEAMRLDKTLRSVNSGFKPLGHIDPTYTLAPDLPVGESLERLISTLRANAAECVFIASTSVTAEQILRIAQAARRAGAEVRLTANLPQILISRLTAQPIGDTMALSLKPVRLTGTEATVKRIFDLSLASLTLLATTPLWLAAGLLVHLTSKGPVLFKQERVTRGGRTFQMYKFRTMVVDGDRILMERGIDPSQPFFKIVDDPRLTWIGNILRKTSIDELPQLLNVIRGEMSLVGPRPLPADQVAANLEMLNPRHEVQAGVTGWWQINGRSTVDAKAALQMDLFYIENWSLALDTYIVLKTAGSLVTRKGAY